MLGIKEWNIVWGVNIFIMQYIESEAFSKKQKEVTDAEDVEKKSLIEPFEEFITYFIIFIINIIDMTILQKKIILKI